MGEPRTDRLIAVFRGPVCCVRSTGPAAALTLRGLSADAAEESLVLHFMGESPQDLPDTLDAVSVLAADAGCYRIQSPPRHWLIWARALYVHRDVGRAFSQAVPAHRAPLGKRLFWRAVLSLARRPAGLRLLARLRAR